MPIALTLKPHEKDLGGGFIVRRLLPAAAQRSVGPFIFFDHMGPVVRRPVDNFDVRPHPHIGLATVTYLFEGAMQHHDSLGFDQRIEPGAVNWMTAGSGIAHSERGPRDLATVDYTVHGLQLWAALPVEQEECEPSFAHTPAADIPELRGELFTARVLIGSAFGLTSPVVTFSKTLYIDFEASPGAQVELPVSAVETAVYCVSGKLVIDGEELAPQQMAILTDAAAQISAPAGARFVVIGGEPLGYRHMWWNFVSTSKERIEQAKQDWREQRFAKVPGETEFIPLPER